MKRAQLIFAALLLVAGLALSRNASVSAAQPQAAGTGQGRPAAGIPQSWQQVPIPPLPAFHPQHPKRIALANGMVIFLQEDHELPLIQGTIRVREGARSVPADKTGMINIYGSVWRTGGTESQTGDQLDDYLEMRAAKVETGGGVDSTSLSWNCLKQDFPDVFRVAVDLLMHPAFRPDKIALAKHQMAGSISRRNDEVDAIAGREARRLAYGRDNPYARIPEYATVAAVTRDDLLNWHKEHVTPNNMIVGVVGDFDSAQMESTLRNAFDGLARGPAAKAPAVQFHEPKPGVYFIEKDDVNQSNVRMVALGIEKNNPDLEAIDVMDQIFWSGGFSSRLLNVIRTQKGLAYSVGGGFSSGWDHPGIFSLGLETKSPSTVDAIEGVHAAIDDIKNQPPTEAELRLAKDAILNSFVFNFDSKEKLLAERMNDEFYGYPADFLEQYRANVEKVTLADVMRVAQKYVHKDQFAILVVGNSHEFGKPLTTIGQVTPIDITIPPPPANVTAQTNGARQGGATQQ
jgi:zinc protease